MGSLKVFVLLCVAGWAVGEKAPTGIQPHHITGIGGYDSFGHNNAASPVYDSHGKGHAKGYAAPHAAAPSYGPPKGEIPVVYYPIRRPKPEKEEKGYFKAFESKMKEYSDKFSKYMKDSLGYGEPDYDYYTAPATGYGPPVDSYGPPPTDSYGPPPVDSYGPPAVVDYEYVYEEEKDKGFMDKMKDYYSKFAKEMEKAGNKMKEMLGYGDYDYDYEVVEVPAPGYGTPVSSYGAPAPVPTYGAPAPAPAYGAPAPAPAYGAHEPAVVYQAISRPKEPKPEKGSFFKAPKAPKRRPIKKPRPGPVYEPPYHPAPQPSYHAPAPVHHIKAKAAPVHHVKAAPVHHAPVHHAPAAPVHHAPTYAAQPSEYGPPKSHDITHAAAPVKAKGGHAHAHHVAPAPSSGVSSYTSH